MVNLSYSEAKQHMINALIRAADAHENARLAEVDVSYDNLDGELPRNVGPEFDKLFLALSFWDGWIDARNHDWEYYKGIRAEDWPRLARGIVADLEADREITDELVRSHFDFKNEGQRPGMFRRLSEFLLRKGRPAPKRV